MTREYSAFRFGQDDPVVVYIWYILHLPHIASANLPLDHLDASQAGIPCAEISLKVTGCVAGIKSAPALRKAVAIFNRSCGSGFLSRVVRYTLQIFRKERGETSWLCLNWPLASCVLLLVLRPLSSAEHLRLWGGTGARESALVLSCWRRRGGVREGMA